MPVYLLHGFRWSREGFTGIRVHGIVRDLNNTSVNYIQNEGSKTAFLASFREMFPTIMSQLEDEKTGKSLEFIEPYDPEDEQSESAICTKFAFVADRVITMAAGPALISENAKTPETSLPAAKTRSSDSSQPKRSSSASVSAISKAQSEVSPPNSSPIPHRNSAALFMNVEEAMSSGPAITPHAWEALAELRDQIAEGEKIGWWIVYNGDPDRAFDADEDDFDEEEFSDDEGTRTPTQTGHYSEFAFLDQPMPSLLPAELKDTKFERDSERTPISPTVPQPSSPLEEKPLPSNENKSKTHSKQNKSFSLPLRKPSKAKMLVPKGDDIPEPPTLKEINKKEGFRHKFFGRRS